MGGCLGKKKFTVPVAFQYSDLLLKVWSSVVNHHFRLAEPFLEVPFTDENSPDAVKRLVDTTNGPVSLGGIRDKIVEYGYSTFEEVRFCGVL